MVSHAAALFPSTLPFGCSYEILTPNAIPKGFMDGKQACEKMVCRGGADVWGRDWALWSEVRPVQWVGPVAGVRRDFSC